MKKNKPGLLARLFGRSRHPVVASLATSVLNQPLLVHPTLGEALVGAYLEGAVTSDDTLLTVSLLQVDAAGAVAVQTEATDPPAEKVGRTIAVVNISGGLVSRPTPGASGPGPVSYAALRDTFDELLEDEAVDAIVLRIDSPGGMASGLFDLVDRIYEARGTKPVHALVDDYAYSAAYALASACDEIWVSRTGGVGSVGVVAFHYDWSGNNEQVGVKVTPIYAGARKVDLNPNFPLSEEALAEAQRDIDMLYGLFVSTVARNRGLSEEAVRGTEAGTFRAQAAIDAGLATQSGTWDDVLAALSAPTVPAPLQPGDPEDVDDAAAVTPTTAPAAAAAEVAVELSAEQRKSLLADAAMSAALPADLQVALIKRGPRADEDPAEAVAYATAVRDACAAAIRGGESLAADYVLSNTDLTAVRTQLLALKAEEGRAAQLVTTLPASDAEKRAASNKAALNPATIYQKRGN